ncbi:MAG: hypothetical protein JSU77_06455 [Fidelibacterota bacterium]|nr:MAG: hypothetical protein JSU77_06455 [Candidatus Neomarinimicrobiota bacterium]
MLRVLVLSFVIATPLLSQDLLINLKGTEYPGRLIEISDTYVYFRLEGQTIVSRLPKQAILRVILADGRVAYENGKIHLEIFRSQRDKKPPQNSVRIAGELLAGGAGGAIGYYGYLRYSGEGNGMRYYAAALYGSTIGSTIGVFLVGNLGNETGSLVYTGVGSAWGLAAGMGLLMMFSIFSEGASSDVSNAFEIISFWSCLSIGATIGFNKTRRYKTPPAETETGLINYQDGQMSFAAPIVYIRPNPFIWGDMVQTIDLASVRF